MCLNVHSELVEFTSNDWGYILAIRQCWRFDSREPLGPGRCK